MTFPAPIDLGKSGEAFLNFLQDWLARLPVVTLESLLGKCGAQETALLSIDVVNGFCREGNLASPRVGRIVEPIVRLFKTAEQLGIDHYVLLQDCHPADSKEFSIYPEHCTEGSEEAKTVAELRDLPHSFKFRVFPKTTIDPSLEKEFVDWLAGHDTLRQFLVVGDCTDICVYELALFLKTRAVKRNRSSNIVVPANCVDTYDIAVEAVRGTRILPHPADVLHAVFLYHMQLNGIQIVAGIE